MYPMYLSQLTADSRTYSRDCRISNYYYETIQMNVDETNYYSIESNSSINTFGYIYKDSFNPFNPFEKLLLQNVKQCNIRFRLVINLQVGSTYILVVTTYRPNVTGAFSIIVSGPNNVSLKRIGEYLCYFMNNQHRNRKYRKCL
jgi:hypothetical protein